MVRNRDLNCAANRCQKLYYLLYHPLSYPKLPRSTNIFLQELEASFMTGKAGSTLRAGSRS